MALREERRVPVPTPTVPERPVVPRPTPTVPTPTVPRPTPTVPTPTVPRPTVPIPAREELPKRPTPILPKVPTPRLPEKIVYYVPPPPGVTRYIPPPRGTPPVAYRRAMLPAILESGRFPVLQVLAERIRSRSVLDSPGYVRVLA